jgi:hypothetical protein
VAFFTSNSKNKSGSSFFTSTSSDVGGLNTSGVNNQINNALTRIQDSGYKLQDADKRNWFEKATNLPQGQNGFFDTLEIISRPLRGITNATKASLKGEDPLKAGLKGLSGKERTTGSELAEMVGVKDPLGKVLVGLGVDVGLDPITYVPGAQFAKAGQLVGKGTKAVGSGVMKASEKIAPKITDNIVKPALAGTKDGLGRMFVPDYKLDETLRGTIDPTVKNLKTQTENKIRFQTEESVMKIADAAKLAGGVEKGTDVGRIMEAPLKQFEDVKMFELPDGVRRTTSRRELKNEIIGNKQRVKELGTAVRESRKAIDKEISKAADDLGKLDNKIRRMYFSKENAALRQLGNRKKGPINPGELSQQIAMSKVGVSPAFNVMLKQRDELKTALDGLRAARSTTGAEQVSGIGKLSQDNEALRASMQNPVNVQRELARPERVLSNEAGVKQAAQTLVKSNDAIREMALNNGIPIGELEGYMTHVLAAEERLRRSKMTSIDSGNKGLGQPNKSVTKQRELMGSAEDVNESIGRTMFEPNAFYATAIGQKKLIEYVNAATFRKQVLTNGDFAKKYEKGMSVPTNAVVIDTNNYKFMKDADDIADASKAVEEIGGQYLVTKSVKQALDRYQKMTTDEGVNSFLRAIDTVQSGWKRLALFSIPYHLRNDIGAKFNNWVGGMSVNDVAKYSAQADKEVYNAIIKQKESALYREYREQGLAASNLSAIEFARRGQEPEEAIRKTIEKRSQLNGTLGGRMKVEAKNLKNPLNAFETSRDFGSFIDQTNRFAIYKWAKDKGKTAEQAAAKVKETQFDYANMTPFENEVATRAIPFYRWMRNNIPYQLKQFTSDPRKYIAVNKLRLNAQEAVGLDEENVPEWMKQQFAIPVSGSGGKGNYLSLGLPLADLAKLSNPAKMLLDSTTPLAKLPAEIALNRNFYFDKPIKKFEGEKKYGIDATKAYVLESLAGPTGRALAGYLESPDKEDQDTKFRTPTMGIRNMVKEFDAEKSKYYQQLDKLHSLQDLMKYIEQQDGTKPRTVNEIKKSGSSFFR